MRAEPSLSQHRQKPRVSMTKIFEVEEDLISCADGELSGPVDLVFSEPQCLNGKCQAFKIIGWLFLEERAPKKRGETTWRVRSFSLVRCSLKEP